MKTFSFTNSAVLWSNFMSSRTSQTILKRMRPRAANLKKEKRIETELHICTLHSSQFRKEVWLTAVHLVRLPGFHKRGWQYTVARSSLGIEAIVEPGKFGRFRLCYPVLWHSVWCFSAYCSTLFMPSALVGDFLASVLLRNWEGLPSSAFFALLLSHLLGVIDPFILTFFFIVEVTFSY